MAIVYNIFVEIIEDSIYQFYALPSLANFIILIFLGFAVTVHQ